MAFCKKRSVEISGPNCMGCYQCNEEKSGPLRNLYASCIRIMNEPDKQ